jgi:hypothetical protein
MRLDGLILLGRPAAVAVAAGIGEGGLEVQGQGTSHHVCGQAEMPV